MEATENTPETTNPLAGLTTREKAFVACYCQYRNAAKAARSAGYSEKNARHTGYENLTKPHIQAAISALMEQFGMSAGECIGRLSSWGRGTMDPFMTDAGELTLTSDDALENRHLIKKVKQRKTVRTLPDNIVEEETYIEIELHDAKDAVDKMLQVHGRYKQVPGDLGKPKEVNNVYVLPDGSKIQF